MTASFRLDITDLAAQQIRQAAGWWHANRPAAPGLLAEELDAAFRLITIQPLAGSQVLDAPTPGVRRVLLRKTQYHVYYRFDHDREAVVVLAFWSARRGSAPRL